MLPSYVSRCVGASGPNGISLSSFFKYAANKWFGGAKPVFVGAKSSTVPLSSAIVQSRNGLLSRLNLADRLNQYADRNRLINLYTKQYRNVQPSPRISLRGFGTLFSLVALAPAIRSGDSESGSDAVGYGEETSQSLLAQLAELNAAECQKFGQAQDADVKKLDDLHILRRATNADGDAWALRGALDSFIAKRNSVVNAIRIEEVIGECFTKFQVESVEAEFTSLQIEELGDDICAAADNNAEQLAPIAGSDSDCSEFSVVDEESADECAKVPEMGPSVFEHNDSQVRQTTDVNSCRNVKSLHDDVEDDGSMDYTVISDEATEDQAPFCGFNAAAHLSQPILHDTLLGVTTLPDLTHAGDAVYHNEARSVCETVFKCDQALKQFLPDCDVETRNDTMTRREAVADHVLEWLNSAHSVSTESDTSAGSVESCNGTLLRRLHDNAEYFVYAFADRCAIPAELTCKLHHKSAFHLVLPHYSQLHVPMYSVLSDQLMAAYSKFGAVRFDSTAAATSIRAITRMRLANTGGIIRSLCTLARLGGTVAHAGKQDAKESYLVVRQRPVPFRSFLTQLELEVLESRARSWHLATCVRAFDSVILQLLEFGWTALMVERLRFVSYDFEQLIDALGVEVDAFGAPRVVLLGEVDSFDNIFSPTRARSTTRARESFAAFAFVVYLNVSRLVEALELTDRLDPKELAARQHLVHLLYAAREDNVGDLHSAMENLHEVARLGELNCH